MARYSQIVLCLAATAAACSRSAAPPVHSDGAPAPDTGICSRAEYDQDVDHARTLIEQELPCFIGEFSIDDTRGPHASVILAGGLGDRYGSCSADPATRRPMATAVATALASIQPRCSNIVGWAAGALGQAQAVEIQELLDQDGGALVWELEFDGDGRLVSTPATESAVERFGDRSFSCFAGTHLCYYMSMGMTRSRPSSRRGT